MSKRKRQREERKYRQWKRRDEQRQLKGDLEGIILPRSPPPTPYKRMAVDRKLKSYKKAIKRTSVQLLVAAAAGHQYREVNLATRQGRFIEGIDRGIPRRYRAFEARGSSNLSSNEAAVRTIRNWLNEERARRRHRQRDRSHDGRVSIDSSSDDDSDGDPGAMAKMAEAAVQSLVEGADAFRGGPSSGQPNQPAAPDPFTYNPRRWTYVDGNSFGGPGWDTRESIAAREQPQDLITPTGWLTWKEQEEQYPTLDTVLKSSEIRSEDMWYLHGRTMEELEIKDPMKRPRVEPNIITKLSIERGYAAELPEMNPLYTSYSQIPATLPPKLSDEQMNRGPRPVPPRLPLAGPIGPEMDIRPKPAQKPRSRKDWQKGLDRFDPEAAKMQLPASKYTYGPDHPETSTFRFADGKGVADIFKPGPLDEPNQIRGSQQLADYGLELAERERPFKVPYSYQTVDRRPAPGFTPLQYDAPPPMSEAERQARTERIQKEVNETIEAQVRSALQHREREESGGGAIPVAGRPGVFVSATPAFEAQEAKDRASLEGIKRREGPNLFHHYEKIADYSSSVHKAFRNPTGVPRPPKPPPQPFKKAVRFDIPSDK